MIKEYPPSTSEYWHNEWINKRVLWVNATTYKVTVKHK